MALKGTTISFVDRPLNMDAILDPSSAQMQLWLAKMKRDHNQISGREMAQVEQHAAPLAKKAKTIYNPFTGEFRRVEI